MGVLFNTHPVNGNAPQERNVFCISLHLFGRFHSRIHGVKAHIECRADLDPAHPAGHIGTTDGTG